MVGDSEVREMRQGARASEGDDEVGEGVLCQS